MGCSRQAGPVATQRAGDIGPGLQPTVMDAGANLPEVLPVVPAGEAFSGKRIAGTTRFVIAPPSCSGVASSKNVLCPVLIRPLHCTSIFAVAPMPEPVRLARRVAELAACTRAQAEQYIQNGWVTVDGRVIEAPQHPVTDERVELAADARLEPAEPATLLLHKPAGYDTIRGVRPAASLATAATQWADDPSGVRLLQRHFQRLTPLVPLDAEASGLMVLSQDGRVIKRLLENAGEIEHEYLVETSGDIAADGLLRLNHGLSYGGRVLPPCKASWQNEFRLRFAIKDVRNGQLRAMCAQVGLDAVSIRRLRIGRIGLGKGPNGALPSGQWRYLPVGERF
jgi:23S rRNA pseudouridine2604 synthase